MENDNIIRTADISLGFQDCDAPRIEANPMMAGTHVQSVEEQLAKIDDEIARFDDPNGKDGRIESEISNNFSPRHQNVVGLQGNVSDPRLPRLEELDEPIANIRGKVRNVRRKSKQMEYACNMEDKGQLEKWGLLY